MYSYEERIRADKLYIKLRKRTAPIMGQLGYVRSRQKYSEKQKKAAVQLYLDHDLCIASTMKVMGYPCRGTLTVWIEELHPEIRNRVVGHAFDTLLVMQFFCDLCREKTRENDLR